MILENLDKITNQLHKNAERILTAFPTIYPNYSKGVHFRLSSIQVRLPKGSPQPIELPKEILDAIPKTEYWSPEYRIFCTTSAGFRHTPYQQMEDNGYDFTINYGKAKVIIFDFSNSSRPRWYFYSDRNCELKQYDFPDASKTLKKRDVWFFKNVDLAAMATNYNGGRKNISSRGGKKRAGKPSNNKGKANTRANSVRVKLEIESPNTWDVKELTLVDAYKIVTKWGYKGEYKSLSQSFRRNGYFIITNEMSKVKITAINSETFDNSSLGVTQLTLNNTILKENLNENINLKENLKVKLNWVTSNPKNNNKNAETINEALFPENYKEVKTKKSQLKKSDIEYTEPDQNSLENYTK